jgi:hypothetical protein
LQPAVANGLELRQEVAHAMADEMLASGRDAINTKGFELEAERMGKLMRDTYRIGFIDVGGWDTHVNEGAAQGTLASNLSGLGRGLQAFAVAGPGMEQHGRGGVVRVRPHVPGERQPRHRSRARHCLLGARRRGATAAASPASSGAWSVPRCSRTATTRCSTTTARCSAGLFRSLWSLSPTQCDRIFQQTQPAELSLV